MHAKTIGIILPASRSTASAALTAIVIFDEAKPGEVPPGQMATKTTVGNTKWTIEEDPHDPPSRPIVLKQFGQATNLICRMRDKSRRNGFVQVKFKGISRKEE